VTRAPTSASSTPVGQSRAGYAEGAPNRWWVRGRRRAARWSYHGGLVLGAVLRRIRLRSRVGWTLTVPTVKVPSRAATIGPVPVGVVDDADLEHELPLRATKLGMTDKRRTTGRLRSPWARRWARLGLAVFSFGGAAVVTHFWMGQSWRYVLVMGASLTFVLVAAQEVLEARGRGRTGQ
jgi:hypothetical protein